MNPEDIDYVKFFLNTKSNVILLETFEIFHPNFTVSPYRVVRNAVNGIDIAGIGHFDYYPLKITSLGARDNLDSGFKIQMGDLGEILPKEMDALATSGGFARKPKMVYRAYRNDTMALIYGPLTLEISHFTFNKDGATFEAKAPSVNVTKTGRAYTIGRFPMLRGFL